MLFAINLVTYRGPGPPGVLKGVPGGPICYSECGIPNTLPLYFSSFFSFGKRGVVQEVPRGGARDVFEGPLMQVVTLIQ